MLYDSPVKTLEGKKSSLRGFRGKALLIVNVASECGLTTQYRALQRLQEKYGKRGFTVVGFPCNQFARQEPGSAQEIRVFCTTRYRVTFPLFEKIAVNGRRRHPIYKVLTRIPDADGEAGDVEWNFEKFVVSADGETITRFRPTTKPDARAVVKAIEAGLPKRNAARSRRVARLMSAVCWAALASANLSAAHGLDPSFGTGGVVLTNIVRGDSSGATALDIQTDGKVVVAGSGSGVQILRYDRNGSLDVELDGDGIVSTPIAPYGGRAHDIVVQADGDLLVVGAAYNGTLSDFLALRYHPDGSLDSSFGKDGIVVTPMMGFALAAAIDPHGRVIAGGTSNGDMALVRYEPDGSLDESFGIDGVVRTPVTGSEDLVSAVAVDGAGRIVVTGYSCCTENGAFIVARYESNGTLDRTFDRDGIVTTPIGLGSESAFDLAVQKDGKIVAAGLAYTGADSDLALVRYDTDGRLDKTFDDDGLVTTPLGGTDRDGAYGLALQDDGSIVVVGYAHASNGGVVAVARYRADGTPDLTFDGDGFLTIDVDSGDDEFNAVVVQPNGRIVAAGTASDGDISRFLVTRFLTDGQRDAAFGADGIVLTQAGASTDSARALALQPDGKLLVGGVAQVGRNISRSAIVRYTTDGSVDRSFGHDGFVLTDEGEPNETTYAVAAGADSTIVAAGLYGGTLSLVRLDEDGNLDPTFGDAGYSSLPASIVPTSVDFVLDDDGTVVATGIRRVVDDTHLVVTRLGTDGRVREDFGVAGVLTIPLLSSSDSARVAIQDDGKIVVAADEYQRLVVARWSAGGLLDESFGYGGTMKRLSDVFVVTSIVLQPDEKILVRGSGLVGEIVARYRNDGFFDSSFGNEGIVELPFQPTPSSRSTVIVQRDGKIVLGGGHWNGGDSDFSLLRLRPNGRRDAAFGARGVLVTDLGASHDEVASIVAQSDGKIVVAGTYQGLHGSEFSVARYGDGPCGDPSLDATISATDALMVLTASLGLGECEPCRCDVDGSGDVATTDALLILRLGLFGTAAFECVACN
jgi:uncharacterized delta-60 repeat protein